MKKRMMTNMLLATALTFSAGAAGGCFREKRAYYECTVEFYVVPEKADVEDTDIAETYNRYVLDNMVKLLATEDFAEYLMLNGESLPKRGAWTVGKDGQDVSSEVNAGIDLANMEMEYINDMYFEVSVEEDVVKMSYQEMRAIWDKEVPNSDAESAYWKYSEESYNVLFERGNLSVTLQAAHADYMQCKEELAQVKEQVKAAEEASQKKIDEALALWRSTNEYRAQAKNYLSGVRYTYQMEVKDTEGKERSALYAEISVLENESFAAKLLSRILSHLPAYVQENMVIPEGYVGTRCMASTNFHEIAMAKK